MKPEDFIVQHAPLFTKIYRELHQIPEEGTREFRTGQQIALYLKDWGIPYLYPIADTGILALIEGKKEGVGNVVALRADMDGLPLSERSGLSFASLHPGFMHACGHDAHMAMVLGTALYFKQIQDSFSGCVKLFFQPAEETIGGAQRMIEAGCMENPQVDYVCGLHVAPGVSTGSIALKHGQMYAASDELCIRLHGKNSHGAYPEQGIDAIVMAASLITALQSVVSRNVSPLDQAVLSFGSIHGGTAHNILAETVELQGTLRTTSPNIRNLAKEIIERHVQHIAAAFGGKGELEIKPCYDALINTDALVDVLIGLAKPILGKEHVLKNNAPGMGVEDFSFFLNKAPGVFFHLGCGANGGCGIKGSPPLHSPEFVLDEDCLAIGTRLEIELIQALLMRSSPQCR